MTERIHDIDELDRLLSDPSEEAVGALAALPGDILILGVAGKMGPTLAWMARTAADRAGHRRRVIGVARFSERSLQPWLEARGIDTISCDLLDRRAVERLPDASLVVYMAGRKFGSTGQEALTWAMNAAVPVVVAERYRGRRIAAFSTGNVYGLVPARRGGSQEGDLPRPVGEYAMSCLGRERLFQHYAEAAATPTVLLRLNYATEMRYGLLVDLARTIQAGEPVDLTMGYINVIWQGDANAMAIASLAIASSPAAVVNIAGPGPLRVRDVATALAERMGARVDFTGTEADDALLSDGHAGWERLGAPRIGLEQLLDWTADWVSRGGETSNKPTHFDSRDGRF